MQSIETQMLLAQTLRMPVKDFITKLNAFAPLLDELVDEYFASPRPAIIALSIYLAKLATENGHGPHDPIELVCETLRSAGHLLDLLLEADAAK